jgi:hypothetical protein
MELLVTDYTTTTVTVTVPAVLLRELVYQQLLILLHESNETLPLPLELLRLLEQSMIMMPTVSHLLLRLLKDLMWYSALH